MVGKVVVMHLGINTTNCLFFYLLACSELVALCRCLQPTDMIYFF